MRAFLLLAIFVSLSVAVEEPNADQLAIIIKKVTDLFASNQRRQPQSLRLAFHACVGPSGCNGCINLDDPNNNGLKEIIEALEVIVQDDAVKPYFSRADLWSMAGVVAAREGIRLNNEFCETKGCKKMRRAALTLPIKWGRKDCDTAPYTTEKATFPEPNMSGKEIYKFFKDDFGFKSTQTISLMGAHSLGKCEKAVSGYDGAWTEGRENHFNNDFYRMLFDDEFEYKNMATNPTSPVNKKFQWNIFKNGARVGMMLNTDVSLVYKIEVDDLTGTNNCAFKPQQPFDKCGVFPGHLYLAKRYSNNPKFWLKNFSKNFGLVLDKVVSGIALKVITETEAN